MDGVNLTLSVPYNSTTDECTQLAALAAASGGAARASCARCPALAADVAYSILMVPSSGGLVGNTAIIKVRAGAMRC